MTVDEIHRKLSAKYEADHPKMQAIDHYFIMVKAGVNALAMMGVILTVACEGITEESPDVGRDTRLASLEGAIALMGSRNG